MKTVISVLFVVACILIVAGCQSSQDKEYWQQQGGVKAILDNQPVPDLGGWSFERQVVIDTYIARNKMVNTYTYLFLEYLGKVVKICDSKGYPIPYSTQLTAPTISNGLSNPEPSSLYPPTSANATLVQCVLADGQVVPTYWENNVFALPYEVQADMILTPSGNPTSFSLNIEK